MEGQYDRRHFLLGSLAKGIVAVTAPGLVLLSPEEAQACCSCDDFKRVGPNVLKGKLCERSRGLLMFTSNRFEALNEVYGFGKAVFYEDEVIGMGMISHRLTGGKARLVFYDHRHRKLKERSREFNGYHGWQSSHTTSRRLGGPGRYNASFYFKDYKVGSLDFHIVARDS